MLLQFSEHALLMKYIQTHPDIPHVLVDVGAHIGTVSYQFAKSGWRVVAFEPEPYNHQKLTTLLGDFDNVTIIQKAISNEAGAVEFYVSSEHYGIHSLKPFHETHTSSITVESTRVDTVLRDLQIEQAGYLKIDIEGADLLALQSFDFDSIKPQVIMVEFMDERSQKNFGYGYRDMVEYLEQHGYKAWVSEWAAIESYGVEGEAGSTHRFIHCTAYPVDSDPAWGNLIFVPEDDADLFQSVLQSYLDARVRHARGTARKQWLERLPAGAYIYQFARRLYHLFRG